MFWHDVNIWLFVIYPGQSVKHINQGGPSHHNEFSFKDFDFNPLVNKYTGLSLPKQYFQFFRYDIFSVFVTRLQTNGFYYFAEFLVQLKTICESSQKVVLLQWSFNILFKYL